MTLSYLKKIISKKFEGTVKNLTNRAIPIAKKEAVKAMKASSTEAADHIFKMTKAAVVIVAIIAPQLRESVTTNVASALDGIRDIYVTIDNLTINM